MTTGGPDLTDVAVLTPRIKRAIQGPYGPPPGVPDFTQTQLTEMAADAVADAILYSGGLFGHSLTVTARDSTAGYPTAWSTDKVLDEWEVSIVAVQAAISFYWTQFRDVFVSEVKTNEGQSYEYQRSANLLRDQLKYLYEARDYALKQLRQIKPTVERYASILRVRDIATVGVLEWWEHDAGQWGDVGSPGGFGGGQEASVIPWTP